MSNLKRTLILWVVLIVLFVAFYQMFSAPHGATAGQAPSRPIAWTAVATQWLPIGLVAGGFFFFFRYRQRRYAPFFRAYRLAAQGHYEQAVEVFAQYRKDHPKDADGAYQLGATRLALWRLEGARLGLEAAQSLIAKAKPAHLVATVPEHLALTYALLGLVGDAQRVLAGVPTDKADPGRTSLVTAILLARGGEWASARSKLGSFEVKQLAGTGPFARTLDALCIEKLTGEQRHVDRLAVFGGSAPDELAKYWPEFVAFVERAPAW